MDEVNAEVCTVALDGERVVVQIADGDRRDGVTLDIHWLAACKLGLRLVAAAERAAWRADVDGPLGSALFGSMVDQVLAEVGHADDPLTWLASQ